MTLAHHLERGGFQNPWPPKATLLESLATVLRIPLSRARSFDIPVEPAKTVSCNFSPPQELDGSYFVGATWLGHAVRYFLFVRNRKLQVYNFF
jgi:N-acyl-phosphatidylethanolamine-hydrolysing phospholipase D